jgi:branched-chain amino acid transport system substrate-binding protein
MISQKGLFIAMVVLLFHTFFCGAAFSENGVTDNEILLGSSLALEGNAKYLGTQTLHGALSYINFINAAGGVNGRKIKVVSYDDGYDPDTCLKNTQKLIKDDKVFSLFCYVGTPTGVKALPAIKEGKIPIVGMFTGANAFRDPVTREVFNIRSSYFDETDGIVRRFWEDLGVRKIAVFYQNDAYGKAGLAGVELALKKYDSKPVVTASYERTTGLIADAFKTIREAKPEAVVMIGLYGACAQFILSAKWSGFDPYFHNVSFVGAEELAKLIGSGRDSDGVIVTQVVPPPATPLPGIEEYKKLLKQSYPDDEPNFVSLEGFFNAKVMVEALNRMGPDVTREKLVTTLESIKNFDAGLDTPITFSPDNHSGSNKVYFSILKGGKYQIIKDWKTVKTKL